MKLTKKEELEILQVYNIWLDSYLNGNVATYDKYLDKDYHFIGSTNNEEFLSKKDTTNFFKATADQLAGKTQLRNETKIIEKFEELVFITHLFDAWFLNGTDWNYYGRFRFSNTLKKNKEGWRFIYQHFSTTDSKAQEGETIGFDKISAENLQLREAIKRRTIELEHKSKELEIEAALERVRAVAMSMGQPDDMLKVCHIISDQLQLMNVQNIRNVQTFIINEQKETLLNYQYFTAYGKTVTEEAEYNKHPKVLEMVQELKKSTNAIFKESFEGEALNNYREYRKKDNQFPDPLLDEALSAHFCFYSIGHGGLGLSTYKPLPKTDLEIFKRFHKVFTLAYHRYMDVAQAEAQAAALLAEKQRLEVTLSDLQATQSQLIQSEKMASLGELTAGIAHEIQNPLNFVNNFSEVSNELINEIDEELAKGDMEEVKALLKDIKQNLIKINHHGKRADGIVKGMLQHSRSSSGTKEETDINILVDEYLRLGYHGLRAKDKSFNAALETHLDDSIENINIVPQDIGRVVLNLITNAFYACNEKRKLQIEGYDPKVTVSTTKSNNNVLISVEDNGNGIPRAIVDKIFQPFFTTKPTGQGTGLGLSLSYDIVKAHGGALKVETKSNDNLSEKTEVTTGTKFIIQLPLK